MITTVANSAEIVVEGIAVGFLSTHSDYPDTTSFVRIFADTMTVEEMLADVKRITDRYWGLRALVGSKDAHTNLTPSV